LDFEFAAYHFRLNKAADADFFSAAIYSDDGNALVFISKHLLQPLAESRDLFIDGTFKTVPTMFYQLVTIHMAAYSHVFIFI